MEAGGQSDDFAERSLVAVTRQSAAHASSPGLGRWFKPARGVSLRARLLVLCLAAVLPALCVIAFTEYEVHAARQREVHDMALRSAEDVAFDLTRIIDGIRNAMQVLSRVQVVSGGPAADCTTYLSSLIEELPDLTSLYVVELSGQVRCASSTGTTTGINIADAPYFRNALQNNGIILGEYSIGRFTGAPILPLALALHDNAGQPSGVLIASLNLRRLSETLRQRGMASDSSITIADRQGVIVVRQPFSDRFVGTKIPDRFMYLVNASAPGVESVLSQDGTPRVLGYVPVSLPPVGLYVSVGLSAEQSYRAVDRAARIGFLIALCAALATFTACWMVGQRAFIRPVYRIRRVLNRWQAGHHAARTGLDETGAEVGELGAALDRMMDQIQEADEQRKLLTGELSHRIKNTLATVLAIANSTMNKQGPATELLPAFNARIVALASTHEVLMRDRWEHAELHDIVTRVLQPLCGDVDAQVRISGPQILLQPREALGLTMVLHELCTNAIKYGALSVSTGHVAVTWSVRPGQRGAMFRLRWQETGGPPIRHTTKPGFGTRLMARSFGKAGSTNLEFAESGVICSIEIELPAD